MSRKRKARTALKPVPQPSPKPVSPAPAKAQDRIGEIERRILAALAEQRKAVERGRVGMLMFSRTVNTLLIPVRAALWMLRGVFHPIASAKILRDGFYIWKSGMFDAPFYLRVYPDVVASAANPILHYCMTGWREMRNPRPDFITAAYLEHNRDIKVCGMNPFYHYVRYRGVEPHREGTASVVVRKPAPPPPPPKKLEITKVPAPMTGEALDQEVLSRIAMTVRMELYGQS